MVCAFLISIRVAGLRVAFTMSFMERTRRWGATALGYLSAAAPGCGVQTGDGERPACILKTDALLDLDATRPDLDVSPRELLSPLSESIEGTLLRPNGGRVDLRFDVALDESSASITYRDEASPEQAVCDPTIALDGSSSAEGGEVFSGTGPVRIQASAAGVWLELESSDFMTTLHPPNNPCATPGLVMLLTLGDDCTWTGDWNVTPPLSADTGQGCELDFPEPLGTFSAEGNCR